mmetsp:Transcript_21184/g.24541  ORF Transcript_21184/g.24541 Transcript_21184/m.24541 type:complete len:120 (-) Transcript_21184:143-502(-)
MSTMLNFVPMTTTTTIQMINMNMIGWKDKSCTSSNSAFISSATVDWDCLGSYQIEKDKENDEACTRCCRAIEITKASLLPTIAVAVVIAGIVTAGIVIAGIVIAIAYANCSSCNIMNTR